MKTFILLIVTSLTTLGHPGIGIVKDSKGNIFYTDLRHVWKIDPDGKKSVAVQSVHSHELFIDEQDNLFGEHLWYNGEAEDTWGHFVWRLTARGEYSKVVRDTEGFRKEFSFVRDHQGRMYHVQGPAGCQHVVRINANRATTTLGSECLNNVRWMTEAAGQVYLIDGGNVKQIDAAGKVTTLPYEVPQPGLGRFFISKDHYLGGLAVDNAQNVYLCDYSDRKVKKISKNGEVTVVVETGRLWSPAGIIIDETTGDIWLLENSLNNEARVEKIERSGKRKVY